MIDFLHCIPVMLAAKQELSRGRGGSKPRASAPSVSARSVERFGGPSRIFGRSGRHDSAPTEDSTMVRFCKELRRRLARDDRLHRPGARALSVLSRSSGRIQRGKRMSEARAHPRADPRARTPAAPVLVWS
jgi:hypothetical protein